MILFLHNRYRTAGGEERAVEDLIWLVQDRLGEPARLIGRDSASLPRSRAAIALLRGGERPAEVAAAVRESGARIVHAHNLNPLLGWRALAAAREAGAKVVLHLHQYRLVCAVGVCFTDGERCTRCHGRNTLPGLRRNCRGSAAEAVSYAAALSLWQSRIAELADAVIVPSAFASRRLRELGAPLRFDRVRVLAPPLRGLAEPDLPELEGSAVGSQAGHYALIASRLAPEKGIDVAIEACIAAGRRLLIAGEGPERERLAHLAARAPAGQIELLGAISRLELSRLRAGAAVALVPSRTDETFGIAAAEAMAAGRPVIASDLGALSELLESDALVPAGDPVALAERMHALWGDLDAGARNRSRVSGICDPAVVAKALAEVYDGLAAA
ncbi:MAG TPA: glycosyltransferase family 4 protein [Solirubrobacteraceae bacterium]|jgi:glycosyltransferase involved in cell wall biosynthesis|nr:glycosyltransferase family 4 protein [Solirubrobacteraceae bacterium]